ncbi:unnamed protein product [Miscanthus lutarioriparius]|uniref:Uncharacterized protein n=1 Tax=Miscanthus lutarioriparius TaxID=422564 RepID=A0A811SRX8_9POAL|nr:unnamed protein product [Miscanthus lutarioriparius]
MSKPSSSSLLLLLLSATLVATICRADPDPVQDFCVAAAPGGHYNSSYSTTYPGFPCKPSSLVVSDDFFFAAHASGASTDNSNGAAVTPGNVEAFRGSTRWACPSTAWILPPAA